MPRSQELGDLWGRAMELCECKRIDAYAYRKARYTLNAATTAEQMGIVIGWLEQQPDWTEAEFLAPDWYREELREQEMLGREARRYMNSIKESAEWLS